MAHFIKNDFCVCCGVCVPECPHRAISDFNAFGTVEYPKISAERCDDCGACAAICPTQAICVMGGCPMT
ncbi:MAG: 4Fe-4S binding protein [Oscillospiraceae bacterium]|jgi:formate hydrogenlyase subunit 6/NADH:ubiquinone oxidoreductase subunit I|nr:4Fe-4S binding protein [Oscillospiraceae bacterium]